MQEQTVLRVIAQNLYLHVLHGNTTWETCASNLNAEVEIYKIILLQEIPMAESILAEVWLFAAFFHNNVVAVSQPSDPSPSAADSWRDSARAGRLMA